MIKDYRKGYLETLAHVQIKDTNIKSKNIVYIFNNWMFTSYPSLNSLTTQILIFGWRNAVN